MNKFSDKYNFELKDELLNFQNSNIKTTQVISPTIELIHIDLNPKPDINSKHNYVKIEMNNSEEDIKKIKVDSKNYYENLKRKIILNHKLLTIFIISI